MAAGNSLLFGLTVLLLSVFSSFVSSLYFHIEQSEKKCFLEEIPDETVVVGTFHTQRDENLPSSQDLGIFVEAKDPDGKLVLSQQYGSEGKFIFTSQKAGEHKICLQSNCSERPVSAGGVLMVHLDIRVGERTNNYEQIVAREKLTELQLRVRQLTEQVRQIQRELNYQRLRERHFREVSHSSDMWIFWWPVARSLYVVAITMICHTRYW